MLNKEINASSISIYDDIVKNDNIIFDKNINIYAGFDRMPKATIFTGDPFAEPYNIEFRDSNNNLVHNASISSRHSAWTFKKYIEDINILIYDKDMNIKKSFNMFKKLKTGNVIIAIESSSLGDTLAWIPYIDLFIKKHKCKNAIVTTFWNQLFIGKYKNIVFKNPGYRDIDTDIIIPIGWFNEEDRNIHKNDPRTIPLQKVAADILGVEYIGDVRPKINIGKKQRSDRKYICIATESTAGCKYWHYQNGWQTLVNDIRAKFNYDIHIVQRGATTLTNIIDNTGDIDILERVNEINNCEFFIGLSSGLSWLAWALNIPTVVISGFTHKFCEFDTNTLRLMNDNVCHGCFNETKYKFDRGDWNWCPNNKNFECTINITPEFVLDSIINWRSNNV